MFTVKVISLGFVLCLLATIGYLYFLLGPIEQGKATGLTALRAVTLYNPLYWFGVAVMFLTSFAFFKFVR
jgi:hypothetical protein